MTLLRIAPEAEEELAAATQWYESQRPGLGVEVVVAVDRAFGNIAAAPLSNTPHGGATARTGSGCWSPFPM